MWHTFDYSAQHEVASSQKARGPARGWQRKFPRPLLCSTGSDQDPSRIERYHLYLVLTSRSDRLDWGKIKHILVTTVGHGDYRYYSYSPSHSLSIHSSCSLYVPLFFIFCRSLQNRFKIGS